MNRGSHGVFQHRRFPGLGFNEAPIHESGKSKSRTCDCPLTMRFNEAPIHESGKC